MLRDGIADLGLSESLEGVPILKDTDIADAVIYSLNVPHYVQVLFNLENDLITSIYVCFYKISN